MYSRDELFLCPLVCYFPSLLHNSRNKHQNERAIGDCVLAKICWYVYNAHCIGDSDNWNIVDYIDVWLAWKSIGFHVLAYDANALYPSLPIWPVLWPGDVVIRPLILKMNRVLYSAKMHLCIIFCKKLCHSSHGENETIAFKHEYRRPTLTSRCDVINIKRTFFWHNFWRSFHIWCQNEPISIIS